MSRNSTLQTSVRLVSVRCSVDGALMTPAMLAHAGQEALHATHHPLHIAALHHLHHLLHLLELAEQLVYRLHRDAGAGGDAALAGGLDELGLRSLLRRHRVDDALDALQLLVILQLGGVDLRGELLRQLVEERRHAAHLLHLCDLLLEVLEVEPLSFFHLLGDALPLLDAPLGWRSPGERRYGPHAEKARRHALGMERLEPGELLA